MPFQENEDPTSVMGCAILSGLLFVLAIVVIGCVKRAFMSF